MPGPRPKDPAVRARANKAATHDVLEADGGKGIKAPPLTAADIGLEKGRVHPLAQRWWRKVWRSPMAPRYLELEQEDLYMLARLWHRFWSEGGLTTIAAEIRHQEARLALDLMGRRRADIRIESSRTEPEPTVAVAAVTEEQHEDPRKLLRAVK